ncbi:MAG TPA: hypothetical protein VIM02_03810 [Rhizomicrobium sp.]|jgi:hypothetical protein
MIRHFLIPLAALAVMATSADAQTGQYVSRSGMKNSGEMANFSDWYVHCTPDVQSGYTVRLVEYHLEGDRQCGAWADCQLTTNANDRICVSFRLQGHNEGLFGGGNNGSRQSEMVITYTVQ